MEYAFKTDRTCARDRFLKPKSPVAKMLPADFSTSGTSRHVGLFGTIHLDRSPQRISKLRLDPFVIEIGFSSLTR